MANRYRQPLERFWERVDKTGECWLWTAAKRCKQGYGSFQDAGKTVLAHRWIYQQIHGPVPPSIEVCHKCDTPACVRPDHLFSCTHSDNMVDGVSKRRFPGIKLTSQDIYVIREFARERGSIEALAYRFNVRPNAIRKILRGERWKHLGASNEI